MKTQSSSESSKSVSSMEEKATLSYLWSKLWPFKIRTSFNACSFPTPGTPFHKVEKQMLIWNDGNTYKEL